VPLRPLVADVSGDGPAVVLLHGQPGVAANWWRVAPLLAGRWRVLTPDRLGYGRTGGPAGDFAANARSVTDLLDRHGIEAAVVVGHSWAGAIGLRLALEFPDRLDGLVLVSSVAPGAALGRLDRLLARRPVGDLTAMATLGVPVRALRLDPAQRFVRRALREGAWDALAHSTPGPGAWRSFAAEQRTFVQQIGMLTDRLPLIETPTVVVAGTADYVVGPGAAGLLVTAIPNARLHRVEGGGHLLPWDHPGDVADAIDELRRP
jgi:pimeloyl-ACP methyl ester carboxylesterase